MPLELPIRRPITALMASIAMCVGVRADFTIRGARIAEGDLWVLGQVDEPNTTITLDDTFVEKTDSRGRFRFRLSYHPATCTVNLKTESRSRVVVIGNCGQRGPTGPIGPPGPAAAPDSAVNRSTAGEKLPADVTSAQITSCGAQSAHYTGENGFQLWVTRKGTITKENPLRPGSPEQTIVLQVRIGTNIATAYGPDFQSLIRGAVPQQVAELHGASIAWAPTIDGLPQLLQIVSESGPDVLAKLQFKTCGAPPGLPKRPSPPAAQPATPLGDTPQPSNAPRVPVPRGALE